MHSVLTAVRLVLQGVRPAALQKVRSQELAEFIAVCIRARNERPRARQLLKAPYFDSIRERCTARCDALSASTSQVSGRLPSLLSTASPPAMDGAKLPARRARLAISPCS